MSESSPWDIPFNRPYLSGKEFLYLRQAIESGNLAGDGTFTRRCQDWLRASAGSARALLTNSCTAALEMCALLLGISPGDEVLVPSYTFVSTANAFVLRGAVPVFVDVRDDTLNLDEEKIEAAITSRTRAIAVVHYAGVGCEMDRILEIAGRRGLAVVEDDAQGVNARYRGRPLGGLGHLAAVSFHETKNLISGEGGALLVNDPRHSARAEILWQKGTDRQAFLRGEVDKYSWIDVGSSFLASELTAAFLWAQMEASAEITAARLGIFEKYQQAFAGAEANGLLRRPIVPGHCTHNGHMFYVLARDAESRTRILARLRERRIQGTFHYVPLHSSPAGRRLGRSAGPLPVTESVAARIVRLPVWVGMTEPQVGRVVEAVLSAL
ncbi:MAG: dTDP-4-amino-4,6-dideoxygalactose transaminase [Planctomycetes bacterium]|nr:dTDP-4-amino-4,6-dideoxygalactose transaminase [Planctomycetota bacterium]